MDTFCRVADFKRNLWSRFHHYSPMLQSLPSESCYFCCYFGATVGVRLLLLLLAGVSIAWMPPADQSAPLEKPPYGSQW